jgi:hypothetical protein
LKEDVGGGVSVGLLGAATLEPTDGSEYKDDVGDAVQAGG